MAAAKHNIIVSRGEDFSFTLTVADSSSAIDITGETFKGEIRRDGGKPLVASFSATVLNQTANNNADKGKVLVHLDKDESIKLDAHVNYKWDLFRKQDDTGTTTTRLIYGDVKVENNITDTPIT